MIQSNRIMLQSQVPSVTEHLSSETSGLLRTVLITWVFPQTLMTKQPFPDIPLVRLGLESSSKPKGTDNLSVFP